MASASRFWPFSYGRVKGIDPGRTIRPPCWSCWPGKALEVAGRYPPCTLLNNHWHGDRALWSVLLFRGSLEPVLIHQVATSSVTLVHNMAPLSSEITRLSPKHLAASWDDGHVVVGTHLLRLGFHRLHLLPFLQGEQQRVAGHGLPNLRTVQNLM